MRVSLNSTTSLAGYLAFNGVGDAAKSRPPVAVTSSQQKQDEVFRIL